VSSTELDLGRLQAALAAAPRTLDVGPEVRRAAVATVLRPVDRDLEVLLIRRAQRDGDPWSGHMAFPGGRSDPTDADLRATSMRETHEEVGLDLGAHGQLLGQLDDILPGGSRSFGLVVSPFVFWVPAVPALRPDDAEVEEIHWAALGPMMRGERDTTFPFLYRGQTMDFPAFRVGRDDERLVWGMTHRALTSLFDRLRGGK